MLLERDARGRFLNTGGPTASPRRPRRQTGKPAVRGPNTVRHYKVDAVLTDPAEREAYRQLLADPTATTASLQAWLAARPRLPAADLKTLSKMVSDAVETRRQIEQMRSEAADQARLAARRAADDEFYRRG